MDRMLGPTPILPRWPASRFSVILLVLALFVLLFAGPLRTVPAGHAFCEPERPSAPRQYGCHSFCNGSQLTAACAGPAIEGACSTASSSMGPRRDRARAATSACTSIRDPA